MNDRMSNNAKGQSLVLPFVIGVILGITAKLVDVPYVTYDFPKYRNHN
jgi:hypothetical protein